MGRGYTHAMAHRDGAHSCCVSYLEIRKWHVGSVLTRLGEKHHLVDISFYSQRNQSLLCLHKLQINYSNGFNTQNAK